MFTLLRWLGLTEDSLHTSAPTAVATMVSLLVARGLKMPEFYWAPISTTVILFSTINPLTLAGQRSRGNCAGCIPGSSDRCLFSA